MYLAVLQFLSKQPIKTCLGAFFCSFINKASKKARTLKNSLRNTSESQYHWKYTSLRWDCLTMKDCHSLRDWCSRKLWKANPYINNVRLQVINAVAKATSHPVDWTQMSVLFSHTFCWSSTWWNNMGPKKLLLWDWQTALSRWDQNPSYGANVLDR